MPWFRDRRLLFALALGLVVRLLFALSSYDDACIRDECTYLKMAERLVSGQGITSSAGWLWAPGYPFLLGVAKYLFGYGAGIVALQIVCAGVSAVLVYAMALRAFEGDTRVARTAALLYLLSPHQAFFSTRLWSEVIYGTILLGVLLLIDRARRQAAGASPGSGLRTAALVGFLAGTCVLFRGVATYMVPILALGFIWGRWRLRVAQKQVVMMVALTAITVAPYSAYATHKFGAFVITDRTLGQMMYLGNNDFEPISFDYGNGELSKRAFDRERAKGREPCAARANAMDRDTCQTQEGVRWMKENPLQFVKRMPLRVAQMLTPHTLLTRHLRWDRWPGMPWWLDEALILWTVGWSLVVLLVGAPALAARAKGAIGLVIGLILLYHVAAISVLAGISRYRVPLEPFLMVYAAAALARPADTWEALRRHRWRLGLSAVVLLVMLPLVLWFLPAGWPEWRHW